MKYLLPVLLSLISFPLYAKKKKHLSDWQLQLVGEVMWEEAETLHRALIASLVADKVFFPQFPGDRKNVKGWVAYGNHKSTRCIFYSNADTPKVVGTVSYPSVMKADNGVVDLTVRKMTAEEYDYYVLYDKGVEILKHGSSIRKRKDMAYDVLPFIYGKRKQVYIVPSRAGYVTIGGDYLVNFNSDNTVEKIEPIHQMILSTPYSDTSTPELVHTHFRGDQDPAITDVYSAMIFYPLAGYKNYKTISANFTTNFDGRNVTVDYTTMQRKGFWRRLKRLFK